MRIFRTRRKIFTDISKARRETRRERHVRRLAELQQQRKQAIVQQILRFEADEKMDRQADQGEDYQADEEEDYQADYQADHKADYQADDDPMEDGEQTTRQRFDRLRLHFERMAAREQERDARLRDFQPVSCPVYQSTIVFVLLHHGTGFFRLHHARFFPVSTFFFSIFSRFVFQGDLEPSWWGWFCAAGIYCE